MLCRRMVVKRGGMWALLYSRLRQTLHNITLGKRALFERDSGNFERRTHMYIFVLLSGRYCLL